MIGYCLHHAKKQHDVNNNTLRDAQKLQKTKFRAVILGISCKVRTKTPRGT